MTKHDSKTADELIVENAPVGATEIDDTGKYWIYEGGGDYLLWDNGSWIESWSPFHARSLADIAELVELRKKNVELEKQVQFEMEQKAKAREQRDKITKSLPRRDLEQQLKTAESFLNMSQVIGKFGRGAISEADAIRKRNKTFKELQALKDQG